MVNCMSFECNMSGKFFLFFKRNLIAVIYSRYRRPSSTIKKPSPNLQTIFKIEMVCKDAFYSNSDININSSGCYILSTFLLWLLSADIDECAKNSSICQFTCANTDGSYICSCPVGYVLRPDKRTCTGLVLLSRRVSVFRKTPVSGVIS